MFCLVSSFGFFGYKNLICFKFFVESVNIWYIGKNGKKIFEMFFIFNFYWFKQMYGDFCVLLFKFVDLNFCGYF